MQVRSLARRVLITLVLAASLIPANSLRAQWEDWLGGWMIYGFGLCGAAGCYRGPNLCAVVQAGGDSAICYES
jgi:hypothetical protein